MDTEKNFNFICKFKIFLTDEHLEQWIDKTALYSRKHWLILIKERLDRIEKLE